MWDSEADRWLREVVQRTEGSGGLAKIARTTRRPDDVRAWCESLTDAADWNAALAAFEEAVELVAGNGHVRGEFFDGAALAAQELGNRDLSPWLERAWRGAPSFGRLRRWLGSARGKQATRKRAAEALEACPEPAHRQRAFLHLLQGDCEAAASLLAAAPGLGWSNDEHPGPLLFPLFVAVLAASGGPQSITLSEPDMDIDELELLALQRDGPRLATPDVGAVVRQAGIERIPDARVRRAVLAAMRKAAEKRVTGVTGQKRRRRYSHAASLVAACVACDRSSETAGWAAALREAHRRFPAFRAELDRHLHSP
jgi:hypothetical protein